MPVLVPIIAAGAAYFGAGVAVSAAVGAGLVAAGSIAATVVGMVAGAVIGAAVGAVGAAVTGGDIGEGALWGAVGGAVAGGFAGYGATGSTSTSSVNSVSASENATAGLSANKGSSIVANEAVQGSSAGMTTGEGTMYAAGITTAGQAVSGWASGQAAADAADDAAEEAEKARQEEFDQRMEEIYANHESNMEQIAAQSDTSLALADKNNAAAMEQLNTTIQAEKDTVDEANAREDEKVAGYNESIRGTDATLFNRPTFNFVAQNKADAFSSGFDEAVAKSPNATAEELKKLEEQKAVA